MPAQEGQRFHASVPLKIIERLIHKQRIDGCLYCMQAHGSSVAVNKGAETLDHLGEITQRLLLRGPV